tara:strand:- start:155 stop:409 length:255 start_codon:yes stop_codon:yes gene_type:complete
MQKKVILGWVAGAVMGLSAGIASYAIGEPTKLVDDVWEVQLSSYGQSSFFVVKHNRVTGETQIFNGKKGNGKEWEILPVVDKRK